MDNSEPIYQYVKGEGWIVTNATATSLVVYADNGKRYLLEARPPKAGEGWEFVYADYSAYLHPDKTPILEKFAEVTKRDGIWRTWIEGGNTNDKIFVTVTEI